MGKRDDSVLKEEVIRVAFKEAMSSKINEDCKEGKELPMKTNKIVEIFLSEDRA